jgi:hypothetical protein
MTERLLERQLWPEFSLINGIAFNSSLQHHYMMYSPQLPKLASIKRRISSPFSPIPNGASDFHVRSGINIFGYRGFSVKEE